MDRAESIKRRRAKVTAELRAARERNELAQRRIVRDDSSSKGVGDTVEKVIKKVTGGRVKSCGGCKKRRDALNKMFPYKETDD